MNESQQAAVKIILERRAIRRSMVAWSRYCGFEPAAHHRLLITELEKCARHETKRLAIFLPPGSAKSTYASVLFPPWFLCQRPNSSILTASHSSDLAVSFGRRARGLVQTHSNVLGYSLSAHSQAADRWETTTGGVFFCSGLDTGIAGHRAALTLIDDPVGKVEDADSLTIRNKHWDWWNFNLKPRLTPENVVVLIMTPWHEDDLGGRILATEKDWKVIRIPFYAEDDDPLGRKPGEILWPEYFKPEMYPTEPRVASALYQCRPAPEQGNFFKKEWLLEYGPSDLPNNLRYYGASDHAVSLRQQGDRTCLGCFGVDSQGRIWFLPDIWMGREDTGKVVDRMLDQIQAHRPVTWFAESDHIKKSIGPFLDRRMRERSTFVAMTELTSNKDKSTKAQAIAGRMSQGMAFFPKHAAWWPEARYELLSFPAGLHDDIVDFVANAGRGLGTIAAAAKPFVAKPKTKVLTGAWLHEQDARRKHEQRMAALDW